MKGHKNLTALRNPLPLFSSCWRRLLAPVKPRGVPRHCQGRWPHPSNKTVHGGLRLRGHLVQLHIGQVQLGPHQANHGAQRQQAHPACHQGQRSADNSGEPCRAERGHDREPCQCPEGRETQAAADLAPSQATNAEVTRGFRKDHGNHYNYYHHHYYHTSPHHTP